MPGFPASTLGHMLLPCLGGWCMRCALGHAAAYRDRGSNMQRLVRMHALVGSCLHALCGGTAPPATMPLLCALWYATPALRCMTTVCNDALHECTIQHVALHDNYPAMLGHPF